MKKPAAPETAPQRKVISVTCDGKDCAALAEIVHMPQCRSIKGGERFWCKGCEPEIRKAGGCWRRERLTVPGQISSSVLAPDRDDDWDNV